MIKHVSEESVDQKTNIKGFYPSNWGNMETYTSVSEIKNRYEEGELDRVKEDLEMFLRNRKEPILSFQNTLEDQFPNREVDLEFAVKAYILKVRSINPEAEIKKEVKMIRSEVDRIQSQKDIPREEIVRKWCSKYASAWREQRVLSILYVFEQHKDHYLSALRSSP